MDHSSHSVTEKQSTFVGFVPDLESDSHHGSDESQPNAWQEHEHLSAQIELDAVRLLADAGTPELAKFAIDSVEEQQRDAHRAEFAQALGFNTYAELLAASTGITADDDRLWFVTQIADGRWIGWNFVDIDADQKHATRKAAVHYVEHLVNGRM